MSELESTLSNLFAIVIIDALSKSMTGDKLDLLVLNAKVISKDLAVDSSLVSLILEHIILGASKKKFSLIGKEMPLVNFWNGVWEPSGEVPVVVLAVALIVVPLYSTAFKRILVVSINAFSVATIAEPPTAADDVALAVVVNV